MDATTKKIVKLLEDDRIERRCAAAMVLGELRVKDVEVIKALGQTLVEDNRLLQAYVLEALAGVRSAKVARYVTPLLDNPDEEIRVQAAALLANQGAKAANFLAKELNSAPLSRRRAIVNILCRNHDTETFARLIGLLPDPEVGEFVLNALRGEMDHMSDKEGEALREQVAKVLKDKTWLADAVGAARALRLLGYMRDPKLVRAILPFATEKRPLPVRLAALAALRRPLAVSRSTDEAVRAILPYADDPDPTLARAAVDTLRGLEMPAALNERLMALAEGRHAEARKFAVEALGRSGGEKATQKVIRNLVSHLKGDDPAARDAAERSLARMEGAAQVLVKELTGCDDPALATVICHLLKRQADQLKPADRKTLTNLAMQCLERGQETAQALLDLLAVVEPESYAKLLLDRAVAHKRAKRFEQAFALLCKLDDAGMLDDDGRYAAAVAGLSALPSKKELGRASRTTDPVLRQLVALVSNGYALARKLCREKSLTADDLFFVGFNFSESKDEDEKEFGGELLAHLASTSPRSKLGRSARNKLKLVGIELE